MNRLLSSLLAFALTFVATDASAATIQIIHADAAIGAHWETHLERMVEFWCTMMLDTRSFSGSVFGTHMQLKGVEPLHFERWMSLWYRHTAAGFEAADRKQLREKAEMIGRSLFLGFFSTPAKFIADDDGRVVVERC